MGHVRSLWGGLTGVGWERLGADLNFEGMVGDDEGEENDGRRADEGLQHKREERVLQRKDNLSESKHYTCWLFITRSTGHMYVSFFLLKNCATRGCCVYTHRYTLI